MESLPNGDAKMVIDGKIFRHFESFYWDMKGRIAELDATGVDIQLLSPLPELLGYWLDPRAAQLLTGHINASIAAAVAESPGRLLGIGALPLQDVEGSVATVRDIAALGLRGVLLASNVNGISIADPRFYPVLAAIEAANMAVFIHGYRPAGTDRLLGAPVLGAIVGVPSDCAYAISSFIMTDILARFPALRLCFVHGGGSFGAVLDRFDHVWRCFPNLQEAVPVSPRDYVRRFFFDTVTFGEPYLRFLIEAFGADTLVAGSDGPTVFGQRDLKPFVISACRGDADIADKILAGNARRLLGLPPS